METKREILLELRWEFDRWEDLLAELNEAQLIARSLPSSWSVKDTLAHLWAWQQRSIARLAAARQNSEPEFPHWPEGLHPDSDDEPPDKINAWIYETNKDRTWEDVHRAWRSGFLRFLELGEAIPEPDLLEAGKYPWMEGYPVALVLTASYEHHHIDHLEPLLAWLGRPAS